MSSSSMLPGCCTSTAAHATPAGGKLGCFDQALLTLAHPRKNETFTQPDAGFAVPQTTA